MLLDAIDYLTQVNKKPNFGVFRQGLPVKKRMPP